MGEVELVDKPCHITFPVIWWMHTCPYGLVLFLNWHVSTNTTAIVVTQVERAHLTANVSNLWQQSMLSVDVHHNHRGIVCLVRFTGVEDA